MDKDNLVVSNKPTPAFVGASWVALLIGFSSYGIGLWNSEMLLNEKGLYSTLLLLGLFSAISLQKSVRDKAENIPVTGIYYGITWAMLATSLVVLSISLWNADLLPMERGFYGVSFALALFGVVAIQKNVRDLAPFKDEKPKEAPLPKNHDPLGRLNNA